jgi:hypothetical protein
MSEPMARQIVLASRPKGPPTPENFCLEEAPTMGASAIARTSSRGLRTHRRPSSALEGRNFGKALVRVARSD